MRFPWVSPAHGLTLQHPGGAGWRAGGRLGAGRSGFWARPGSLLLDHGHSPYEPRGVGPQSRHLQNGVRRVPASGGWSREWLGPTHTRHGTQRGAFQRCRMDFAHVLASVFLASLRILLMNESNDTSLFVFPATTREALLTIPLWLRAVKFSVPETECPPLPGTHDLTSRCPGLSARSEEDR